jgi:hypothetical protein
MGDPLCIPEKNIFPNQCLEACIVWLSIDLRMIFVFRIDFLILVWNEIKKIHLCRIK